MGTARLRRRTGRFRERQSRRPRRPLQRQPPALPQLGAQCRAACTCLSERSTAMRRFSLRRFVLGLVLGALGAAAVLTASAYARTPNKHAATTKHVRRPESGRPVVDWNRVLLTIVNTPGAQPANIQPTRNFAILHAAIYDAVNAIDRTHEPYLISVRAPRHASETAAADAAAHTALVGLYPGQQSTLDADYAAELAKVTDGPAKDQG